MNLTPRLLLAYALPAFALAALYLPLYTYVTPFYAAERGVDLAALGSAWIAIRLFDAVSDPAIGWLSDRTPGRYGRRRVWLIAAVPVIVLGTWQAFVPPEDAGLGHAVFWLFVVTLGWTMAQTPYAAWGAEIAPDYDGRTRVTSWRESLVLIGTLGATLAYVGGGGGGAGLQTIAILVSVGLPIAVFVCAVQVPDRPLPQDPDSTTLALGTGLKALISNVPFRTVLGAWFLNGLANGLPVTLFLFFTSDLLGLDQDTAGLMFLLYFTAAILGVPFWSWLAGRTSKHRAWCIAMLWACIVFSTAMFLGPGDVIAFGAISVLTGLAFGADLTLPPAIQADVIELDRRRSGRARAGMFFAIWQVATKAALALSSGLALILLGVVNFSAGGTNSETALWVLALLYAGAPIVLKLAAVATMWNFPIDRLWMERSCNPERAN